MNRFKPWLLLSLVFLAGICVGVVGTRVVVRKIITNPPVIGQMWERDLIRELKLTPEQRTKVQKIFARTQEHLRDLRNETQPRVRAILENSNDEIAATLTPEQLPKFKEWVEKKKERLKSFSERPSFSERRGPVPPRPSDRPDHR